MTARSGGQCERCGHARASEQHHRVTRRFGPDCPCNLVDLCAACHHGRVHAHPTWARERGLIVPKTWPLPPAEVPLLRASRAVTRPAEWVILGCDGAWAPVLWSGDAAPLPEAVLPDEPPALPLPDPWG